MTARVVMVGRSCTTIKGCGVGSGCGVGRQRIWAWSSSNPHRSRPSRSWPWDSRGTHSPWLWWSINDTIRASSQTSMRRLWGRTQLPQIRYHSLAPWTRFSQRHKSARFSLPKTLNGKQRSYDDETMRNSEKNNDSPRNSHKVER